MQETRYTWEDFDNDIRIISGFISASGWFPDFIIGVKRGGLIPAVRLSHILKIPMKIASTDNNNISIELKNVSKSDRLLLVDEICDSGDTLQKIRHDLLLGGYIEVRSACLYYNIRQSFIADYYARKIDRDKNNNWIVFPWES